MSVKTIVTVILSIVISCSCSIRSKYNLEEAISKNAPEVIGENHYEAIDREMVTHQPAFEIRKDLLEYRFGDIAFTDNSGGNFIRLIVNSANERKIIGVLINIGNNVTEGDKMKSYLDRTFGNPEIIVPEPTGKYNGFILGNSTYFWTDPRNNSSVYFYRNYAGIGGKQCVGYSLEIIRNDAVLSENPDWRINDWYKTRF